MVDMTQGELCDEKWRDVVGYENLYQVSSTGEVRSVDRFVANGNGLRFCAGKQLELQCSKQGYMEVALYKDGRGHRKQVHRLVAEAFILCPDEAYDVDHINLVRDDNRVENLRWLSRADNMARVYADPSEGTKRNMARFKEKGFQDAAHNARKVRLLRSDGMVFDSVASAARELGYNASTYITNHLNGKVPHCKGYTFEYLDDDRPRQSRYPRKVAQVDRDTGDILRVFQSVGEACSAMSTTGIPNCLSGKNATCCGYRWEYVDDSV